MDITTIITAALSALVAIATVLLSERVRAKGEAGKLDAEAQEAVSRAADTIIDNLLSEIERLEERVKKNRIELQLARATMEDMRVQMNQLEIQANEYLTGIRQLVHQIRAIGAEPVYEPTGNGND